MAQNGLLRFWRFQILSNAFKSTVFNFKWDECDYEFYHSRKLKKHVCRKYGSKWILTLFRSFHVIATCVNTNPEPVLRVKNHIWRKTWLKPDFDIVQKSPCFCNLFEHKSRACSQGREACMQKTWLNADFVMIRKFPCYCNMCEHEYRASAQSKEAPMEKTWPKTDFDIIWKFPYYWNLCEHKSRAFA